MHMKKATNITLATLAAALLASSCIKEADPYEIATEDQVTLETLIEGIPASLVQAGSAGYASEGQAWDFALPAIHIATESMTGDVAIGGNIGYDWFAQWGTNEALGADYAVGALTWNNYYAWIMATNNVIKQIDASDFATLDATQKSYLGFAYAYRAMFYLDLVRLYEFKENNYTEAPGVLGLGVPIVLPETTEAEAKNNPRAKVDDIYDQVIFPDLDKAEELLSGFTAPDKYTISPALVYGLKARAWLERGTAKNDAEAYVSAAEYARLAINASGCTPLTQEQWEDPSNGFNSATANNAWIWGLALPSESVANLFCFTAHMSTENAWSAYGNDACRCINSNLYNSIDLRDFRRHSWLDPDRKDPEKESYDYKSCRKEGKEYFNELPDYANIKFRPAQGAYEDFKVGGAADHPYMRVEEMYFTAAEAALRLDDLKSARELMNTVMAERDPGYSANNRSGTLLGATTTTWTGSFLENILTHRRIELWGEYGRLFDVRRLGQGIDRRTDDGFSEECISMMNPRNVNITKADTYDWVLTIPKAELDANPNINEEDQNP